MKTKRPLTSKDAIRYLTLMDADLTNEEIQQRLGWLGLESCTTFLISCTRKSFRDDVRFLRRVGMLNDREPVIPSRIRRLRPPDDEPVRYHYGRQSGDD
jgi:hypothetical protein